MTSHSGSRYTGRRCSGPHANDLDPLAVTAGRGADPGEAPGSRSPLGVGRLSDRIGRRPIQIAGLVTYALASLAFAAFATPLTALLFRALQGAGAGAADVAGAAVVGETAAPSSRGRAFAMLYGCRTAGLAIGPLAGSILGTGSMRIVFAAGAICAVLATVPVALYVPKGPPRSRTHAELRKRVTRPLWRRAVLGVVMVAASTGLITGTHEVCWSLLLHLRGPPVVADRVVMDAVRRAIRRYVSPRRLARLPLRPPPHGGPIHGRRGWFRAHLPVPAQRKSTDRPQCR